MSVKKHPLYNKWRNIYQCALTDWNMRDNKRAKKLNLKCDWTNFRDFRDDVEFKLGLPKPGQELVRKDMRKGWHLNNLHYADRKRKGALMLSATRIKYKGKVYCAKQLAAKVGVNYHTFRTRLQRGWTVAEACKP